MRMPKTLFLAVGAICVAFTAAASAQSPYGSVRGHVYDEQKAVLAGVAIRATSPDAPGVFTATTDADGLFRLVDVPPGRYSVSAELPKFAKLTREPVIVRAGLNVLLDVELKVGGIAESVDVRAESQLLESSSAVQAINISGEFQRHLPIAARRDWADSLLLTPGVVAAPSGVGKAFYFLHGADFSSLVMQVDGADMASTLQNTNTYISLSTEALQDVQIKTGAVDASTPIGAGAVMNVVTQSGTNRLKGAAGFVYQGESWNGTNAPGGTSAGFEIFQPDASVGGPIGRNRLWYFGAYRYTNNSIGISQTAAQLANLRALVPGYEVLTSDSQASYYFGKVTAQLTPSHRLEGFWQRDHSPENFVGPTSASRFFARDFGGIGTSARLSSVWTNTLTTRVGVSFNNKGIDADLVREDLPSRNVHQSVFPSSGRLLGTGTIAILDNAPSVSVQPADKVTISADATWYRGSPAGSHDLQAGLYLQPRLRDRTTLHYVNGGYALEEVVLRDPSNLSSGFIPFHRQVYDRVDVPIRWADSHDYAIYVQDAWHVLPRFTINGGVRADFIGRKDVAFDIETENTTEIAPRFGLKYLLTSNGRRAVRVSWTRVAELLAQTTQSAGSNVSGFRDLYDTDLNGTFETTLATPGASALSTDRVLDDARHQPHTDEWIVGYQQQLPGQVTVDASFVRREFRERTALVEINGIYDGGVFKGYQNQSFNDILKITNNVWNWPVYTFFELQATKQTARVQGIASYTHQWRHLAGTWQPNDPASFIQPDAFPNSKGIGSVTATFESQNSLSSSSQLPLLQVQTIDDVVRLGASYRGPWDILLATSYSFESGLWSGPVVTRVSAADPRFGPATVTLSNGRVVSNPLATTIRFAYPTRTEGQLTLPSRQIWNIRIGKDLRVGDRRLEAAVDVFNVTNNDAFYQFEIGAAQTFSPLYGQGRQRQAPRAAQLSLRLVF